MTSTSIRRNYADNQTSHRYTRHLALGRKDFAKQSLDGVPLDLSHGSKRHGIGVGRVLDLHVSKRRGELGLLTLRRLLRERDESGRGGGLTDERDVVLPLSQEKDM